MFLLLLTGTIDPEGMSKTKLLNVEIRRAQYIETIKYYLHNYSLPIVFVENSGNDLSTLFIKYIEDKRLEILTYKECDFSKELGKGYGEMKIFKHAFAYSKLLSEAAFIFKITGRYKLVNFNNFIDFKLINIDCELFVDLTRKLKFADSRFFGFTKSFYNDYFKKYEELINDSNQFYFETALAKASLEAINDDYKFYPFPSYPKYVGFSGTDGKEINSNFFFLIPRKFKYLFKYFVFTR